MARELGVKAGFLRAYLASKPDVREILYSSQRENDMLRRRNEFLMLKEKNKGLSISRFKLIPRNGYAWLLRNDRDWLLANMPGFR